jgi:transketolase
MSVAIDTELSTRAVNTIKFLSVDAVQKANSGHPGMPMGAADVGFVLWSRFLRYDPTAPDWADRDRFILSAGHGCMLLYSLLHLSGHDLPISEIESFRQWGSKTPGHPEFGHTVGVEATTGPLGQGIGNGVGMAIAGRMLAARFNGTADFRPVGQRVFVLASDGDVMEGVSGEASSMAGHLGLGNLIVLYDDNNITIEGDTSLAFSEDVGKRHESYGWQVQRIDGHDHEAIAGAIAAAEAETARPSMIVCRTHIAHGAPTKQDTSASHGSPLGEEEIRQAKQAAGWPLEPAFHVPEEVRALFRVRGEAGSAMRAAWQQGFDSWRVEHPELAAEWDDLTGRRVPADITEQLLADAPTDDAATRAHGGAVLQQASRLVPSLTGGSADLEPSNKTRIKDSSSIGADDFTGRNFHFGVREHAMGAIVNGMLYHGSFRPYAGTFLIFSDYMRPSIRLAALAGLPAIYVFTHDSIFVGEDGPTHEPIEQAASLRLIPGLHVYRPADGFETALAWGHALARNDGPTALLLTRQKVPAIVREATGELADPGKGAYLVAGDDSPDAVVAATGSELHLALAARKTLAGEGKKLNVVSVPCNELFRAQGDDYRDALFPRGVPVATVEAGRTDAWSALTGRDGLALGIDHFGASAPASELARRFGFTAESVTGRLRDWLG